MNPPAKPTQNERAAGVLTPAETRATKSVRVHVDGVECEVEAGTNLLEAARKAGREVPHFCYHPGLSVAGNCRLCLVETGMPKSAAAPEGAPDVVWAAKPAAACATPVADGMHIRTESPLVRECRKDMLEFINLNHPLDCPVCDKAGECSLQNHAFAHGRAGSRYDGLKNRKPKQVPLGARVVFDAERCILCGRCVRFCREISRNAVLGFTKRGSRSELACFPGMTLDDNYSLNTVDLCPVGALTSAAFRFKSRVWFLSQTPSICPESSAGVNTTVWHRDGRVYRITPRRNDAVNDFWMPDSGRELFHELTAPERMTEHLRDGVVVTTAAAIAAATELLQASAGCVGYVASSQLTVEAQFLAAQLREIVPGPTWLPAHPGTNDGLLLSEERTPNFRGALLTGLFDRSPDTTLASLVEAVESGAVRTLVVFREDITALGIPSELLRKSRVKIIYFTLRADETATRASVVFPALSTFEKDGSFVNRQFRLQKFLKAVSAQDGIVAEIATLARLLARLKNGATAGEASLPFGVSDVWRELGARPGPLHGISFEDIPLDGLALDAASTWRHIALPEIGPALHFAP